tara:strand:+ start:1951 stop:2517 length:567 start_codon:yes stop_codon:yes gene_type:complete
MKTLSYSEKFCWIVLSLFSFGLGAKYFLFLIVLFVLRFKLTYRDISLVKERLSSFIYSPVSGVVSNVSCSDDFYDLNITLFPVIGDMVLSPGKFFVCSSSALNLHPGQLKLTLGKNNKLDLVSIGVTPFLKNKPPVTNLLENDIINEDSVITQSLFGGTLNLKFSKEYNLRIKQGDIIWCSRSIIAGR